MTTRQQQVILFCLSGRIYRWGAPVMAAFGPSSSYKIILLIITYFHHKFLQLPVCSVAFAFLLPALVPFQISQEQIE